MTEKPLFIPLKGEYFDRFEDGTKRSELRKWGPRWNMRVCEPGRAVVLSRGYGKQKRLSARIGMYVHQAGWRHPAVFHDDILAVFGSLDVQIVRLDLVEIAPLY